MVSRAQNQLGLRLFRLVCIVKRVDQDSNFARVAPLVNILFRLASDDLLYLGLGKTLRSKLVDPFGEFVRIPIEERTILSL